MYQVGEKIIYSEHGVCEVKAVGTLAMQGVKKDQLFYTLCPVGREGVIYAPVDSPVYMRPVMCRSEAEAFLEQAPDIAPAVCQETKITRADAYYKSVFSSHSCAALLALLKGLYQNQQFSPGRGSVNLRIDRIGRRARDLLNGELAAALGISPDDAERRLEQMLTGKIL